MDLQRRARRCHSEIIFTARPHRRAIAEQDRFEIKIWPLCLNLKFCRAALPANGFDIEVPILVVTKRDSRAVLGINDSNQLLVSAS